MGSTADQAGHAIGIRGGGIAALCCAHLLRDGGLPVTTTPIARPPLPVLMLSDQALTLMRDVFCTPLPFAGQPRITRRIVAWGDAAEPIALPHGAIVLSEDVLLGSIGDAPPPANEDAHTAFTIHSARAPDTDAPRRFGSRHAWVAPARLRGGADPEACWVESVAVGWLFLIPAGGDAAWLLGVGSPLDQLLATSRHVAALADLTGDPPAAFDSCPRMVFPLRGADWLLCGTAALGFDPICGDGTAQAIREAILASAVVTAIREGGDAGALLDHYQAMLLAAMRRHLTLCADYYRTGGTGDWWRGELAALMEGHGWCTERLGAMPEPRYGLSGFRLVAREALA